MNPRSSRNGPSRSGAALIHRGPQAAQRLAQLGELRLPAPRAERRAPHRLRQRHDGDPLGPRQGASHAPRLGHHQGQGRRAARLRRLAALPAVRRAARRVVDRHDLGAGVRLVEEERHRHPPRRRRDGARLHPPRDRHLHPALGRQRLRVARAQAQGVRQVRHRRRHSRVVERPARHELRRVLQLQRPRRPREELRGGRGGEEVGSVGARHRGGDPHEAQRRRHALRPPQAGHAGDRQHVRREGSRHGEVLALRAGRRAARSALGDEARERPARDRPAERRQGRRPRGGERRRRRSRARRRRRGGRGPQARWPRPSRPPRPRT